MTVFSTNGAGTAGRLYAKNKQKEPKHMCAHAHTHTHTHTNTALNGIRLKAKMTKLNSLLMEKRKLT